MAFTKEQKKEYFTKLRAEWSEAKRLLTEDKIKALDAIIRTHGLNVSATSYFIVSRQMAAQHLEGIPYLDAKTYQGWKENGFQVRKGEKSTLGGITWIQVKGRTENQQEGENDNSYVMPKSYNLFHRSQVEAA